MGTKVHDITNKHKQGLELEDCPFIGELDIDMTNLHEIIKIGEVYYAVGILSPIKNIAGARKIELELEPETQDYNSNFVCPYCKYEDEDSFELNDEGECHCGRCGATVSYTREVTVEYNTSPVEPPSILSAGWK